MDFVIQITVRGKYTAKIGELVHVVERVTVNCKGRMGLQMMCSQTEAEPVVNL